MTQEYSSQTQFSCLGRSAATTRDKKQVKELIHRARLDSGVVIYVKKLGGIIRDRGMSFVFILCVSFDG